MASIYIHIPFCKRKCHYCDFYSSTQIQYKTDFIKALEKEIDIQKNYLQNAPIKTLYFGGGTPSLIEPKEIENIIKLLKKYHHITSTAEITLECNPDDINTDYLKKLKTTAVNRLSIGIQSFNNNDLKFLNRRHNAQEAQNAVKNAQTHGFLNISIDLIYGLPGSNLEQWAYNLEQLRKLNVPHFSAYHLAVEENTPLYKMLADKQIKLPKENISLSQYKLLCQNAKMMNYEHYEISNFAIENYKSIHNSNYWKYIPYLGLGPSAHSFNGQTRQHNTNKLNDYIQQLQNAQLPAKNETLSNTEQYNEYLLTGLRCSQGVDIKVIAKRFGKKFEQYFINNINHFEVSTYINKQASIYRLTERGFFVSDHIISQLFYV